MAPAITATAERVTCTKEIQSTLPYCKVVKPGTPKRRGKKFLLALQRPTPPPGKHYPVKIQADGLVDTWKAPEYLSTAVKRNTLESPLLRLPVKVRIKIWEYAMGGNAIEIKLRGAEDTSASTAVTTQGQSKSKSMLLGYAAVPGPSDRKTKKLRSAFHLPEVCRSIYRETAVLGYALNDFVFVGEVLKLFGRKNGPDGAMQAWAMERIPAQLNAIKSIRPHWMDMLDYIHKDNTQALNQVYPGLERVFVPKRTVSAEANAPERGDPVRKLRRQQAKTRIANVVQELEGDIVEAVF